MESSIGSFDSHNDSTENCQSNQGDNHSTFIEDATNSLQNVMQDVQTHFKTMSQAILNRIDDMGTRIDQLEFMLNDLISEIESSNPLKEQIQSQNLQEHTNITESESQNKITESNV